MKQRNYIGIFIMLACIISYHAKAQTEMFETKSVVKAEFNKTTATKGKIVLTIKDGWHVNANPASMDFLIPVEITLSENPQTLDAFYPVGHTIETPLGDLMVYSETVSIPVTLKEEKKLGFIALTAQACDGSTCYPPSTWKFPIKNLIGEEAH